MLPEKLSGKKPVVPDNYLFVLDNVSSPSCKSIATLAPADRKTPKPWLLMHSTTLRHLTLLFNDYQ
jgi:hypothetical protein